jgi:integrase
MARLIQCAGQLPPSRTNPLRAETIRVGLILLFCCGLRRGELLRIKLGDLDRDQSLIRVVLTKFHKSRLVPLAPSVVSELDAYLQRPSVEAPDDSGQLPSLKRLKIPGSLRRPKSYGCLAPVMRQRESPGRFRPPIATPRFTPQLYR